MTDIVKRLRDEYLSMTRNEAADEIELLRKQVNHANDHADAAIEDMERMLEGLTRIANYPIPRPYFGKGGATIPEAMRNIARAALEESK